ncbi:MAG: hypothetical protein ACRDXX_07175 [Stackebrandtia sp.]
MSAVTQAENEKTLGCFEIAGHVVEVHEHGEEALWLYELGGDTRKSLGVVRWDSGRAPGLTLSPGMVGWVSPNSPRAAQVVSEASAVLRAAAEKNNSQRRKS